MKRGPSFAVFKQLFDLGRQALFLLRDVEENKQEIAKLRRELDETNSAVLQIAHEMQRISEREIHERGRLELRLEMRCFVWSVHRRRQSVCGSVNKSVRIKAKLVPV